MCRVTNRANFVSEITYYVLNEKLNPTNNSTQLIIVLTAVNYTGKINF